MWGSGLLLPVGGEDKAHFAPVGGGGKCTARRLGMGPKRTAPWLRMGVILLILSGAVTKTSAPVISGFPRDLRTVDPQLWAMSHQRALGH